MVVEKDSLPDCLEITAWTQTESGEIDEIMGLRHRRDGEGCSFIRNRYSQRTGMTCCATFNSR
jgi:anthranilate synthase component 2